MSVKKRIDSKGKAHYHAYTYDSRAKKQVYLGSFDREKDACEAEYEAKRRMRLGETAKPRPAREELTLGHLATRWHDGLVSVRPSTKKDYDQAIRRLKPLIGDVVVSQLNRRHVDEAISSLSRRYAPSTTRKTIVVLKMILRMGVEHDHLDMMPTGGSRLALPKPKKRVFEPLTAEQVKSLVASTPQYWRPFVQLLLTSGLRRSEAWGLRVQDFDLVTGVLHVRGQLIRHQLVELKTDSAYRDVPLPRQTIESLRVHLARLPESDLGLLFPTPEGNPVEPSNFYARVWIPTREKAGLPSLRLHDCRHHVASILLAQGRSITYVQRLLGHSNPSTLLSIYSWVTKGEADIATGELEKWLGEEVRALYRSGKVIGGSSRMLCQVYAACHGDGSRLHLVIMFIVAMRSCLDEGEGTWRKFRTAKMMSANHFGSMNPNASPRRKLGR